VAPARRGNDCVQLAPEGEQYLFVSRKKKSVQGGR
jgi:hypothetical protein